MKERNELAKDIYVHNNNATAARAVAWADDLMKEMYGKGWKEEGESPSQAPASEPTAAPVVSVAEQDGEKGVRLCVGDVDLFIEAHSLDGGKEFEWKKAMERLKEVGKQTFNKHEMYLIAAYRDEINEKMHEIGGEELEGYYWSSTEYGSTNAWYVYFSSGTINGYTTKYGSLTVRPCAAFNN